MEKLFLNFIVFIKQLISNTSDKIGKIALQKSLTIATAESCTGGLISSRLTDISGSSSYIKLNLVTYSNEAKQKFLNVSKETLDKYGAVSEQCAREMAKGLLDLTNSNFVLCTTGVAGPQGSENKPVGLIYCACGNKDNIFIKEFRLNQAYNRKNMKFMFSEYALKFLLETISK